MTTGEGERRDRTGRLIKARAAWNAQKSLAEKPSSRTRLRAQLSRNGGSRPHRAATARARVAAMSVREDELEDQLFGALEEAAQKLPLPGRLLAAVYLHRVREIVELRRARTLERDRAMCDLYGRIEALERARR